MKEGEESIQHRIGLAPPATHAKTIPVPAPHFSSSLYAPLAQTEAQVSDLRILSHPSVANKVPSFSLLFVYLLGFELFFKKKKGREAWRPQRP